MLTMKVHGWLILSLSILSYSARIPSSGPVPSGTGTSSATGNDKGGAVAAVGTDSVVLEM